MFVSYVKISFRNLIKYRAYSIINIIGLAVGLTCCALIMLYLQNELSYDRFHKNADRIYRIEVETTTSEDVKTKADTPFQLAPALMQDFSELENTTRFYNYKEALISVDSKNIYEDGIILAEPKFLEIFTFPLLVGFSETALSQPNTIILTSSMARKYFGEIDPLGKTIRFNNNVDLKVTGVVADVPSNSHFNFNFIVSLASVTNITDMNLNQWGMYVGTYAYTMLTQEVNVTELESKMGPALDRYGGKHPDETNRVLLQPLTEIHLFSHDHSELAVNNYSVNLYIIATIGLLILSVACINYMNLATARSIKRAREIGMRKVLGAGRIQLLYQHLGESIMFAFIAFLLALILVEMVLPIFNELTGKRLIFSYTENISLLGLYLLLAFFIGIVSGLYPAFVLSSFKPIETVKNIKSSIRTNKVSLSLRKILVVGQFTISITLIIGTLVVEQQLDYFRNAKIGFDKEMMLVVQMSEEPDKQVESIKNTWLSIPDVKAVTASFKSPIGFNNFNTSLYPEGRESGKQIHISVNCVDYNFSDVYSLEFLAGRNFSSDFATDKERAIVINESLVKKLGFNNPQEAIGKIYRLGVNSIDGEIIGVVKDFHIASMQTEIEPLVMLYWPEVFNVFSVKIKSDNITATISSLESSWQQLVPKFPFQYQFLDDYINSLYAQEEQTRSLVSTFSGLTVFIACLGLFGLVAFTTQQRTKEIGIRKVVGASTFSVLRLLTKDFIKLILTAGIIACPVAYFVMNKWLEDFAYRIDVGWWMFLLSGGIALLIALATVSFQAIKAAIANPVEALKYE